LLRASSNAFCIRSKALLASSLAQNYLILFANSCTVKAELVEPDVGLTSLLAYGHALSHPVFAVYIPIIYSSMM
jgi:3-dehydroquinate synthetase